MLNCSLKKVLYKVSLIVLSLILLDFMTINQLLKKHGILGPVVCAGVVLGSVYGAYRAIGQIRTEWGYLKKNSRQDWKDRIKPQLD